MREGCGVPRGERKNAPQRTRAARGDEVREQPRPRGGPRRGRASRSGETAVRGGERAARGGETASRGQGEGLPGRGDSLAGQGEQPPGTGRQPPGTRGTAIRDVPGTTSRVPRRAPAGAGEGWALPERPPPGERPIFRRRCQRARLGASGLLGELEARGPKRKLCIQSQRRCEGSWRPELPPSPPPSRNPLRSCAPTPLEPVVRARRERHFPARSAVGSVHARTQQRKAWRRS
jgi:hypothetical protein